MSESRTMVYKFGLGRRPVGEDRRRLMQAFVDAHQLSNRLIAIDRAERAVLRSIQDQHPALGPVIREYRQIETEIRYRRREAATRFKADLDRINAQIAAHARGPANGPRADKRPTAELIAQRDALQSEMESAQKEAVEALQERKGLVAKALATVRRQNSGSLVPQYRAVQDEVKDYYKAALHEQSAEAAASYGFEEHGEDHWGTRYWIKKNREKSFKTLRKNLSPDSDPRFLRFPSHYLRDEIRLGRVCAGINQTKSSNAGPLSSFNDPNAGLLYIERVPPSSAYDKQTPRHTRRKLQQTRILFRIGSETPVNAKTGKPGRAKPIWVPLDVMMHREVPPDAIILEAVLSYDSDGRRENWALILTVQVPASPPIVPKHARSVIIREATRVLDGFLQYAELEDLGARHRMLIDINPRAKVRRYRKFGPKTDGLGYHSSGVRRDPADGAIKRLIDGEFEDTSSVLDVITFQETIQARLGEHFEQHIPRVLNYINSAKALPAPLLVARDQYHIARWPSPSKFQKLYRQWRDNRCEGDEEAFEILAKWAYEDLHLYEWSRNQLSRWLRRRENMFKVEANRICRTYAKIYLDSKPMTDQETGKRSRKEKKLPDDVRSTLRKWKKRAAFATFRTILKSTAERLGVPVVELDDQNRPADPDSSTTADKVA